MCLETFGTVSGSSFRSRHCDNTQVSEHHASEPELDHSKADAHDSQYFGRARSEGGSYNRLTVPWLAVKDGLAEDMWLVLPAMQWTLYCAQCNHCSINAWCYRAAWCCCLNDWRDSREVEVLLCTPKISQPLTCNVLGCHISLQAAANLIQHNSSAGELADLKWR